MPARQPQTCGQHKAHFTTGANSMRQYIVLGIPWEDSLGDLATERRIGEEGGRPGLSFRSTLRTAPSLA